MNFYISKILIWLNDGESREIDFLPNKVNVITGRSGTGKSAIMDIIDYCFFSSESKISESIINENSQWYGLIIKFNGKSYTIARKSPEMSQVSNEYYFSSIGEKPKKPKYNVKSDTLKKLLEAEFSIDSNATFEYGGDHLTTGSKISLRYFQMFNTISGNIIENDSGIFFDKQNEARYREALPRIFDLAVGIESIENILKKDKRASLEVELLRLERKKVNLQNKKSDFLDERIELIGKAKKFSIISFDLSDNDAWDKLKNLDLESDLKPSVESKRENLEQEYFKEFNKVKNLNKFKNEYELYKKSLKNIEDDLKPVTFLREYDSDIIKTSIFDDILEQFSSQIKIIKKERSKNTPISIQVNDEIKLSTEKITKIKMQLKSYPKESVSFETLKDKYFFLGQLSTKISLYDDNTPVISFEEKISSLKERIKSIHVNNTVEKKELTVRSIEDIIKEYIDTVGSALENYQGYLPVFNYKNKSLQLRRPKSTFIENVGSSSNQMFLHLFFTLSLHEVMYQNKSKFVAPYLLIDQPSRPYYGDESDKEKLIEGSDESKIKKAFALLNDFIGTRIKNKGTFQMIVLEHVPTRIISDFDNVHIVEEFRDGNALIN